MIMSSNRLPESQIPHRLRWNEDDQEDLTAPPRETGGRGDRFQYMHQSVFSMIAAAGSKSNFHARFDTSDSEGEEAEEQLRNRVRSSDDSNFLGGDAATRLSSNSKPLSGDGAERGRTRHRRRFSEHRFVRPFQKLTHISPKGNRKEKEEEEEEEPVSPTGIPNQPEFAPSTQTGPEGATAREAPVLSRMIEAKARFDTSVSPSRSPARRILPLGGRRRSESSPATLLSARLKDIFGFRKPEKVLAEYQCWLLQSVLLQGYMYVTEKHICFYAYLPRKANSVVKSGYLSKRGRQNPKYNRYWFALKGDVLSYYLDPSNLYFPSGHIDLRYGISANLAEQKGREKDIKDFVITTDNRTYQFRADSAASAKEWVKTLQKVIFRSHNDGDSVKISLPIENIIDVEENPILGFAETFKIRVVESDDSFAIDEVSFGPTLVLMFDEKKVII